MNDAIDDAMEGDNDEEDEEEVINKVLDEIGVDLTGQVCSRHPLSIFLTNVR